jgi:transcriptional regulator with XRE-family HTH domain
MHVQRWYLKAWRAFRRLTQDALAEKMKTTKATISKLERYQLKGPGKGRQKLNDEWLGRYCVALRVTPQELSGPPNAPRSIDDIMRDASPQDQKRFQDMAEAFIKSNK